MKVFADEDEPTNICRTCQGYEWLCNGACLDPDDHKKRSDCKEPFECPECGHKRMTHFEKLISALKIFKGYAPDLKFPTRSQGNMLYVCINPGIVSDEDKKRLENLHFIPNGHKFSSYLWR